MEHPRNQIFEFFKSQISAQAGSTSKYENLSNAIMAAVASEILSPGATLPGERKMAELLGISRVTVRNAIDKLVAEGHLVRRHGARTSVSGRVRKQISNLAGFSEDIRSRGMTPGTRLLSAKIDRPTELERAKLDLESGEEIVRLDRVRLGDGRPIAIEHAIVPQAVVKSPDAIGPSLYATLDALGVAPQRGVQRITAKTMNADEAALLEAEVGAPALVIERSCQTAAGRAIEYTVTCYNAEVFDFTSELQK